MKKKLTVKEYIYVASMLFGLFFGAGNLIFPTAVGQLAGRNMWSAILGLLITGVGLPLLGVAALGLSRSDGLFSLSSKVNRPYAYFFTCALYLTIGPFFAIPRCATVSFTVGLEQILPQNGNMKLYLLLFTLAFFIAALLFSLRPGKILTWVGKILNPFFLLFLGILVVVTLVSPAAVPISSVEPMGGYIQQPFLTGFLEGYNTMDALASLAFGIIVVQVIRELGVDEPGAVARNTAKAGIFSCLFMGLIYVAVTAMSAKSRGVLPAAENGGVALAQISQTFLGRIGLLDPRRHRNACLPQDRRWPYHQLLRDLYRPVPQGARLPGLGGHLHAGFPHFCQFRSFRHHRLCRSGADVPLPAGHRAYPAGAVRQVLLPR